MKWGLLDETYTMVSVGISTVALVIFLWSESGVSFIACMKVWGCLWQSLSNSTLQHFLWPRLVACTKHNFFFSIFFEESYSCKSPIIASASLELLKPSMYPSPQYVMLFLTASENVLPVLKMPMMRQVMKAFNVFHSFFRRKKEGQIQSSRCVALCKLVWGTHTNISKM